MSGAVLLPETYDIFRIVYFKKFLKGVMIILRVIGYDSVIGLIMEK